MSNKVKMCFLACLALLISACGQGSTVEPKQEAKKTAPAANAPAGFAGDVLEAVRVKPQLAADIYRLISTTYNNMGRLDEAVVIYEKLNQLAGDQYDALEQIGYIKVRQGKIKEAEAAYERLVRVTPEIIEHYYPLIELYRKNNQPEELEALLKQAEEANSGNQAFLNRLAEIRAKIEGKEEKPLLTSEQAAPPVKAKGKRR